MTHLPHLLGNRLAFFPHPLSTDCTKGYVWSRTPLLNPSPTLCYCLKMRGVLGSLLSLKYEDGSCFLFLFFFLKKQFPGEPLISLKLLSTMKNASARQASSCFSFCNLQIVWFCKLDNFCTQGKWCAFSKQSVVGLFCWDLKMTQECTEACYTEISDKGKACGKFWRWP